MFDYRNLLINVYINLLILKGLVGWLVVCYMVCGGLYRFNLGLFFRLKNIYIEFFYRNKI